MLPESRQSTAKILTGGEKSRKIEKNTGNKKGKVKKKMKKGEKEEKVKGVGEVMSHEGGARSGRPVGREERNRMGKERRRKEDGELRGLEKGWWWCLREKQREEKRGDGRRRENRGRAGKIVVRVAGAWVARVGDGRWR